MNPQEWIAAGQGCAISIGFLFVTFKLPSMLDAWIKGQRDAEKAASDERERDRLSRHEMNNMYQNAIGQMYSAHKEDLKIVAESVCRYNSKTCS